MGVCGDGFVYVEVEREREWVSKDEMSPVNFGIGDIERILVFDKSDVKGVRKILDKLSLSGIAVGGVRGS